MNLPVISYDISEFGPVFDDSVSAHLLYQWFADSPCQTSLSWSTDHLINTDQTLLHSAAADNCLGTAWNSTDNDLMTSAEFSFPVWNLLVEVNIHLINFSRNCLKHLLRSTTFMKVLLILIRPTGSSLPRYSPSTVIQSCKQLLRGSSAETLCQSNAVSNLRVLIVEIWTRTRTLTTSGHYLNTSSVV